MELLSLLQQDQDKPLVWHLAGWSDHHYDALLRLAIHKFGEPIYDKDNIPFIFPTKNLFANAFIRRLKGAIRYVHYNNASRVFIRVLIMNELYRLICTGEEDFDYTSKLLRADEEFYPEKQATKLLGYSVLS